MNRYEREKPGTGGASAAVNHAINTGQLPRSPWLTFSHMSIVRHEMRRALLGIDGPNAWCGRNARLRRMIEGLRGMPGPQLP